MNDETADAIKNLTNGKSLQVYLVNPPGDPLRTIGDYKTEQQEARARHAMFVEQHQQILAGQKWTRFTALAAIISAIASLIMAALLVVQHGA